VKKIFGAVLVFTAVLAIFSGCGKDPLGSENEDLWPVSQVMPLESDLFTMLNDLRSGLGLNELTSDLELTEVARAHSEDMLLQEYFDHYNLDGESPGDRATNAGIDYVSLAENIHRNSGYSNPVEVAHQSLVDSPGHYEHMIDSVFTHVGIGVASDGEWYYFTQLFAKFGSTPIYGIIEFVLPSESELPWADPLETFQEAWNK